jgi:hypothetical protein
MQSGSYIWNITLEILWSYADDGEEEYEDFVVTSPDFDGACKKATTICLKNHPSFKDEENPKITISIKSTEIIKAERKEWIDG